MFPLTIAVSILVARILGPADRGIYAFILLMGESMLPILFLGFGVGVIYLISSEKYDSRQVVTSSLLIGLLKGALISVILWVLWKYQMLGQTAKEIPPSVMLPILLTMPLSGVFSIAKQVFKGNSQFGLRNLITVVYAIGNVVFLVIFVVVVQWGIQGAVIAIITQKVVTIVAVMWVMIRQLRPSLRIDMGFIRESYSYGIKAWVGNMATLANERFDQLILSFFASPTLLGIYAVAFSIVRFCGYFPQAVTPVMFNIIARTDDPEKSAQLTAQVHRAMLIFVGGMTLVLAATGYWLVPWLYGHEYDTVYIPLLILLPGLFAYQASRRVTSKFLGASGHPGKQSIIEGVGAIAGMILYLILIPPFDIVGAGIGSTVAYLVSTVLALYFFYQIVPRKSVNMFRVGWRDLIWVVLKLENSLPIVRKITGRFTRKYRKKKDKQSTENPQENA